MRIRFCDFATAMGCWCTVLFLMQFPTVQVHAQVDQTSDEPMEATTSSSPVRVELQTATNEWGEIRSVSSYEAPFTITTRTAGREIVTHGRLSFVHPNKWAICLSAPGADFPTVEDYFNEQCVRWIYDGKAIYVANPINRSLMANPQLQSQELVLGRIPVEMLFGTDLAKLDRNYTWTLQRDEVPDPDTPSSNVSVIRLRAQRRDSAQQGYQVVELMLDAAILVPWKLSLFPDDKHGNGKTPQPAVTFEFVSTKEIVNELTADDVRFRKPTVPMDWHK